MSTLSCFELEKDMLRYHVGTPNQVILLAYCGADPSFSGYTNPDFLKTLDTSATGSGDGSQEVARYQLIGGYCYLYGMCDGEAVDIAERKGMREKSISSNNS